MRTPDDWSAASARGSTPHTPHDALIDPLGRPLRYLRVSVTDRCDLRCTYCMPAAGRPLVRHRDVLRYEELMRLARVFADLGVRTFRVTGGEPLVRRDVIRFLRRLGRVGGGTEVRLTTNGLGLTGRLDELRAAGVRRVNLSLDSLDRETYRRITRRDALDRVRPLLDAIPAAGLRLKINMVVLPGVNDEELPDFVDLTRDRDLVVRFIEPMPFVPGDGPPARPVTADEILAALRSRYELRSCPGDAAAPEELYVVSGHRGRVGVIRAHTRGFCGACDRLRLDARGRLRTCLYGAPAVDLGRRLRDGADDAALAADIRVAVAVRHADGHAAERDREDRPGGMNAIGG